MSPHPTRVCRRRGTMKLSNKYINKVGLNWNLPFWTPLTANTGIYWYHWFLWVWKYEQNKRKHYCIRILGFQIETL